MMPMMFGTERRLYGVYHPAAGAAGASRGVVLCNPYGQEAYRANRAFRIMADALAGQRMHVLRFDYSCTGDSSGEDLDATLEQWIDDIGAAVEELRAIARLRTVHLLGLRFGAALATLAAASRSDISGLVLWEPVVRGSAYLDELLEDSPAGGDGMAGEADGLCVPAALATGFAKVDLNGLDEAWPARLLLITSGANADHSALRKSLQQHTANLNIESVDDPPAWAEENNFGAGPVPAKTIRTVVQWYE